MSEHRDYARKSAVAGIASLAHAFNACGNAETPYRYNRTVRERFIELAAELQELVEHGDIEDNPAHVALQAARGDRALQALIEASARAPRRRQPK